MIERLRNPIKLICFLSLMLVASLINLVTVLLIIY